MLLVHLLDFEELRVINLGENFTYTPFSQIISSEVRKPLKSEKNEMALLAIRNTDSSLKRTMLIMISTTLH